MPAQKSSPTAVGKAVSSISTKRKSPLVEGGIGRRHLLYVVCLLCVFPLVFTSANPAVSSLFVTAIVGYWVLNGSSRNTVTTMPLAEIPKCRDEIASKRMALRTANGFEFVTKDDIVCIQGGGNGANFIKVYKEGQASPIIANQTLCHTLRLLSSDSPLFHQPHKSYIINIQKICQLHRDEDGAMVVVMSNRMAVPIAIDRLPRLKMLLGVE